MCRATLAEQTEKTETRCDNELIHLRRKSTAVHTVGVGVTVIAICFDANCTICDSQNGKTLEELLEIDKQHN